ncbi:BYS1 domain protein, putative [Talaromyces stipitatus ATCC 10500]|uniref:BYS1 domain protein, putative n=1 Tax=Talaromyces stipitatus (strain ATCC 10500 / CBS 375.48 / QM 6759 / NRRL 1006) TaxID=441959 RepID=B8LY97_TALSN|nr:BYS1 domain protein, putative [Talaromyces stipitatus ATCC 10500]EED23342.1 BYS1 domain protein, putative [Talaromyces stipitatus ATCC 10500]
MKFISATLVGALLPLAHAVGNAIVFNNCTNTIYVWSVGSSIGNYQALANGESYTEQYRHDDQTGGITLKVTAVADGIYNSAPELDYGYTLDNQTIWYDISDVNGDPFANSTVALVPANGACQSFHWADGISPPGIHTASCSAEVDWRNGCYK